mmetsp:Transcript_12067/g.34149  ORF Transcript_12067/g.34149 Transcript_12067/m.34149 type:complete len:202 (-) Transcript_12067:1373-1978(-)
MRPFISVTALVASSGAEKQTNPNPRLLSVAESLITLALVIVPQCANSLLRPSSSTSSARFLTYRLSPANFCTRSALISSNCCLSIASRSDFFCARPTYSSFSPPISLPLSASTAAWACSAVSMLTNPNPRLLPSSSFMMTALDTGPCSANIFSRPGSSTSSGRFLTKMFVNLSSSLGSRSVRFKNGPTNTFLPSIIIPSTF